MRRHALAGALAIGLSSWIASVGVAVGHGPGVPPETGEPTLLVGGDFEGDLRLMALGASGQVVAKGAGDGLLGDASLCPGGTTLVEHVRREEAGPALAIRDLTTFEVVREIELDRVLPPDGSVLDVLCRDEDGAAPVILGELGAGIVELGSEPHVTAQGSWRLGALADTAAIVVPEKGSNEVHLVSLADGSDRLLYQRPGGPGNPWDIHSIDVSPSGDRVAIVDWATEPQHVHSLAVFDLADGTRLQTLTFPGHGGTTTGWWVDDATIALAFLGDDGSQQEPIWGTVMLVDAETGQETGRWQGLTIRPQLVADKVFLGTPVADAPGVLAAVPATGGEPLLVGAYTVDSIGGVHGPVPAPVTALAALPAFSGESLLAGIADTPVPAADGGAAAPLLLIGVLLVAGAVAGVIVVDRRRRERAAGPGAEETPSMPAPIDASRAALVGRAGDRSAEWMLWLTGITGTLVWATMAVVMAGFSSGSYLPGEEPTVAERLAQGFAAALPAPPYLLAIAAAWGLGRGASWSLAVGRLAALLLVASLPIGAITLGAEGDAIAIGKLVGLPESFHEPIALVPQAIAGGVALWGLRVARTITFPGGSPGPAPRGLRLAAWITVALGSVPALALLASVAGLRARDLDGDLVLDLVVFTTTAVLYGATGIGLGLGLRNRRRWSVPPVLPGVVLLSALVALLATAVGSTLVAETGLTGEDGGPSGALVAIAGGLMTLLPGLYVLVTVFRARSQFVFR